MYLVSEFAKAYFHNMTLLNLRKVRLLDCCILRREDSLMIPLKNSVWDILLKLGMLLPKKL
jgi:hypothetical protein